MTFLPEFVWKKGLVWWPSIIACPVSREELMLHRMRSRFSDMMAMSQERRSKRIMRVARQIVGPMSALMWTFSMSMQHEQWLWDAPDPDKYCNCSRLASLIISLWQSGPEATYLMCRKVFFSALTCLHCASISVCTWSSPCQEQSKLLDWISRNHQWTPRVHCLRRSDLFDSFCTLGTWFDFLRLTNTSRVDVGCALSCMDTCICKSLFRTIGGVKVVLADRCENIERLRLHRWTRRFGHVFMQAVASSWLDASALHRSSKDQHLEVERMPRGCRPFPAASNAR